MFHPMQRGGPLIVFLVLKKVHNAPEQHLELLKHKVETLNTSDFEGENADTAFSLINAAYAIFISSSTATQSCVPPEWSTSKTLI
jgi:hypothetical protein